MPDNKKNRSLRKGRPVFACKKNALSGEDGTFFFIISGVCRVGLCFDDAVDEARGVDEILQGQ